MHEIIEFVGQTADELIQGLNSLGLQPLAFRRSARVRATGERTEVQLRFPAGLRRGGG